MSLGQRLRELGPALEARAPEAEQNCGLPEDTVQELRVAGLFGAFVPRRYGGLELEPLEVFEALVELSSHCSATGWVGSLFAVHSLIAGWFPEEGQDRIWSQGSEVLIGSSLAPVGQAEPVVDGLEVSGYWSFSSGIEHADWLLLGVKVGEAPALVMVPRRRALVVEDWQTAGLAGTGSHSLELDGVLVSPELTLSNADLESGDPPGLKVNQAPLYRWPWRSLFSYSFVPPALGTGLAALSCCRDHLQDRRSAFSGAAYKEKPVVWTRLAESAAELETGLALMRRDLRELQEALRGQVPESLTHRCTYSPAFIVELARRAVTRVFQSCGAGSLYLDHPLQRHFRDLHAMAQHPGVNLDLAGEAYGRGLLQQPNLQVGSLYSGDSSL